MPRKKRTRRRVKLLKTSLRDVCVCACVCDATSTAGCLATVLFLLFLLL